MCVSYLKLNSITKDFAYYIMRFNDAVIIFMNGSYLMWIITVYSFQGYQ